MKGTKLINLFKTFSGDEMKSFEKFITSPYFNSVKNHIRLFNELKKFYPDFENSKLTNEYIYKKLFKAKAFNKQIMWNLASGLEKLVREFLVQNALSRFKPNKYTLIFRELETRDLDKLFLNEMDGMEKIMGEHKIDSNYFYYLWALEETRISYWQKVMGLQNAFASNLFKAAELSTLDFLMKLYRKIANVAFYKNTYNIDQPESIFHEVIKNINFKKIAEQCLKSKSKNAKLIEFFCNVILCIIENKNDENFFNVREFLFKNHRLFETDESRNLCSILENFCLKKTRQGDENYRNQLFELHEFRLKQGILTYENGKFNKTHYIQIINNGLILDKTPWVANFIREYTPKLKAEHQKSMRALAESYMNYKMKKYDKVLENVNSVVFIDNRDKMHVKNITAKTYYDMGEYDMLLSHIDSSKHFLRNNKNVSPFYMESHGNFYSYLHKLVIAREKDDKGIVKSIIEMVRREEILINKNWLIEKAKELSSQ